VVNVDFYYKRDQQDDAVSGGEGEFGMGVAFLVGAAVFVNAMSLLATKRNDRANLLLRLVMSQ